MTTETDELLDTQATDAAADAAPAADAGAAAPEEPKSALDAVLADEKARREAEEAKAKPAAAPAADAADPTAGKPTADAAPAQGGEEKAPRLTKAEYDALPDVAKQRIGYLSRVARETTDRLKEVEPVLARDSALQAHLERHRIQSSEFQWAVDLLVQVKTDPAKAMASLAPLWNDLQAFAGEALPADLQERVTAGELSQAAAKEIQSLRSKSAFTEHRSAEQVEADREAEAERQRQESLRATHGTLQAIEGDWKKSDPDYAKKQGLIWNAMMPQLAAWKAEGHMPTKEELSGLARKAKQEADGLVSGFTPAPRRMQTVTGGAAVAAKKEPATAMEALELGLARARAQAA